MVDEGNNVENVDVDMVVFKINISMYNEYLRGHGVLVRMDYVYNELEELEFIDNDEYGSLEEDSYKEKNVHIEASRKR